MVQSSGILNISTLIGSSSPDRVKPALETTSIMQKLVLCDVMVV
jgi:hypothetical protein